MGQVGAVYNVEDVDDSVSQNTQDRSCFTDVHNDAIDYNNYSFENHRCCEYYTNWDYDDCNRTRNSDVGAVVKPSADVNRNNDDRAARYWYRF
ncbi:hypothetical protein AAVH_27501 [Aphelenchoides avenae]|nr:hypothetical protein AAVH_27501 [Aphelenchus avenae]